ncbi:MAG: MOP flippase family protein, partial [Bacteroidetes bacterium]|nr:MOP flippase family protein [Fibrella sp.]
MSNKRKAIDGGKWITISMVISTILQFVQISILAKLLEPAAFGLVSISTLIINFFHTVSDLGFSNSIIYKQEDDKKTLSTLYFLSILLGLTAFCIIRLATPLVVAYYHEPRLERILGVSSFYFIVIFFGQTYLFLLQKELRFRTIALMEVASAVSGTIVSITLALNGFREMSLIYGGLVTVCVHTILQVAVGVRLFVPGLYFDLNTIKEHLRFGMYNVGEGILGYVQSNLDNIMIGGLLGVRALGFYTVAYQLAVFPITKLNPIILQVAYPVLAKMKDDNSA